MNGSQPVILHVDDNPSVLTFVGPEIEAAGFEYISAQTAPEAFSIVDSQSPDLIVLDVNLGGSDLNGLDICKTIRESGCETPVIFLTVRDRTDDSSTMRRAFELGGNDYIAKREELKRIEERMGLLPTEFIERKSDVDELLMRIKAHLADRLPVTEFDESLRIDFDNKDVHVLMSGSWQRVRLPDSQFRILKALALNGGAGITKSALLRAAGSSRSVHDSDRVLQSHIYKLRAAIEPDPGEPTFILTYHGVGYRFGGRKTAG